VNKSKYVIFSVLLVAIFASLGAFVNYQNPSSGIEKLNETIGAYGHFTLTLYDEFGNIKAYGESDNTVVDVGIDCIGDDVFGTTLGTACGIFDYLHIGNGTVAPTSADTGLGTPIDPPCARIQDPVVAGDSSVSGKITVIIEVTFDGANCTDTAIAEAAVFDALTSGNMMARALIIPTIPMTSLDTLTVTYTLVIEMV